MTNQEVEVAYYKVEAQDGQQLGSQHITYETALKSAQDHLPGRDWVYLVHPGGVRQRVCF